jgi:hypothetical protein
VAITNGYCTLAELKASLAITDSIDDTPLEAAITAASRLIDGYTERFFYADGTSQAPVARYYTPVDPYLVNVDDFTSITQLATDDNNNQTYTTIWTSADYLVEPKNNPRKSWPYNRILAVNSYIYPYGYPQSVKVTGVWGWSAVPSEVNFATLIQASRLFNRRSSPFGIAGSPEMGTVRLYSRLDADVEVLLRPFRKNGGLAK